METIKINTDIGPFNVGMNASGHLLVAADGPINTNDSLTVHSVTVGGTEYRARFWFDFDENGHCVHLPDSSYNVERNTRMYPRPSPAPTHKKKIIEAANFAANAFVKQYPQLVQNGIINAIEFDLRMAEEEFKKAKEEAYHKETRLCILETKLRLTKNADLLALIKIKKEADNAK